MNKLVQYLKDSREEFNKITWPSRKETLNYSVLVIVISILLAVFIGLSDYILNQGVSFIAEQTSSDVTVEVPSTQTTPGVEVTTEPVTEDLSDEASAEVEAAQ